MSFRGGAEESRLRNRLKYAMLRGVYPEFSRRPACHSWGIARMGPQSLQQKRADTERDGLLPGQPLPDPSFADLRALRCERY